MIDPSDPHNSELAQALSEQINTIQATVDQLEMAVRTDDDILVVYYCQKMLFNMSQVSVTCVSRKGDEDV
jgi:hypothetical protein